MLDAPDARRRMLDALDAAQTETRNVKGLNAILPGMREMLEGGTFNYTPGGRPWRECRPWVCPGKCPRRGHCPGRARRPGAAGTCPKRRPRSKFGQALARILPVPNFHKNKNPQISKNIQKNQKNDENVQMQKCVFLHFFSKLSKNIQTYLKKLFFSLDATKTRRQENKPCPWGWKGRRPAHAGRAWFATTATISTTNRDGIYDKLRRQLLRITTTIYDNL